MLRPTLALALAALAGPVLAQQPSRVKTERADLVVETVARGLENPWGLAFLPDGRLLVTERPGRLRIVTNGQLSDPLNTPPQLRVAARGQGGLLDVALDPNFAQNRVIYLSFSEDRGEGRGGTSVLRARLNANATGLEAP